MANVIKGGLVGPTGAQLGQQAMGNLQQGVTAGVQIGENKRQFNVHQKMAALDKLAAQTAGGYMTLLQGENGDAFVDEMFGGLGVSNATRERFKETFLNAPPTPQAIYERDLSLFMRSIQEGSGEAAAQESLDSIQQARTNAQTTEEGQGETQASGEVSLPSNLTKAVDETEPLTSASTQIIQSIFEDVVDSSELNAVDIESPEYTNIVNSLVEKKLQEYIKQNGITDPQEIAKLRESSTVTNEDIYKWRRDGGTPPARETPAPAHTIKTGGTNPISVMAETLDTANVPVREEGESTEAFGNRIGDYVNSIIPRSAEFGRGDEGVTLPDGTVLTPQQATVVRQQIIWNLENGKEAGYMPTPKEKNDLPFWKEGYVYGQTPAQETGNYTSTAPTKKADALSSEYSTVVGDVNSELTTNGVVSPQTAQRTKVKVNKILKFRDYDLAEENTPEGTAQREEILTRFTNMLNDPTALRAMAIGMPESAAALLTVADQIKQEKQLKDPDSALNAQLALEQAKLQLQFQKLGLDIQKAQAGFIKQSVELGINLTGMDENTFQKAVLWSMRGEPMLSSEDRSLLDDAYTNMNKLIELEGPDVVKREDFKAWLDIMNGVMNKATGSQGIEYVSNKNYGWFGIDFLKKDEASNAISVVPSGTTTATETVPVDVPVSQDESDIDEELL